MNSPTAKIPQAKSGRVLKAKRWRRSHFVPANAQDALALLLKTLRTQRIELADLKKRLTQLETSQSMQQNTYRVPQSLDELKPHRQSPVGMTPMQAIMGKLDMEQTTEELLAQLKALD